MSTRIHTTSAADLHVQVGTDAQIDEALGYEGADPDDRTVHLVLNDLGNQEALVIQGDAEAIRGLVQRILAQVPHLTS